MSEASFSSWGTTLVNSDPSPPYSEFDPNPSQKETLTEYREHIRRSSAPSPEPHSHQAEEERLKPSNSSPDPPSTSPHPLVLPEAYNLVSQLVRPPAKDAECVVGGSEAQSHGDLSSASTTISEPLRDRGTMNGSHPRQPPAGPRGAQSHVNNNTINNNTSSSDSAQALTSPTTPSEPSQSTRRLPNFVQVAKAYVFEQEIQKSLSDLGVTATREDNIRLAGVQWIDNVRRALKL
jgi:hypothetical protein